MVRERASSERVIGCIWSRITSAATRADRLLEKKKGIERERIKKKSKIVRERVLFDDSRTRAIRNGLAFSEVEEVVTIVRTSCGDWISSSLSRSAEGESSKNFRPANRKES